MHWKQKAQDQQIWEGEMKVLYGWCAVLKLPMTSCSELCLSATNFTPLNTACSAISPSHIT